MVGEALAATDGVLDAKSGVADMFKSDSDPTRGVAVTLTDCQQVSVSAKIIAETGKNIPQLVNNATAAITDALQNTAGLHVKDICVEVTDTMTPEEYEARKEENEVEIYPL